MNGVASSSMRNKGLGYKLNFGVSLQKIKEIATRYQPDAGLAEKLWSEDVRELKILATMLYPISEMNRESACNWMTRIPNQEIREQICINLFQKLSFADDLVADWGNRDNPDFRTTAYWLATRILMMGEDKRSDTAQFPFLYADILSEYLSLKNASISLLKRIGRCSTRQAGDILLQLANLKDSDNLPEKAVYDDIYFEFDFYGIL